MPEPVQPKERPPGFLARHRKFLLFSGAAIALVLVTLLSVAGVVLYKASRVFPRPIPDIVPCDAAIYAECLEFPKRWPDIEAFLGAVRNSKAYGRAKAAVPGWESLGVDRALDQALHALPEIRKRTGVDPLEALAGSETAVAVFLGNEGGPGKPARPSFLLFTRLSGWPVRIAALFPGTVAREAAAGSKGPGKLQYDGSGRFGCLSFEGAPGAAGATPTSLRFAVLRDVLVVSDREDLLAGVMDLAGAELPSGLSTVPAFREAVDAAAPPPSALLRFWADFDRLDALAGIRKKADLRINVYPYNILARYVNEVQNGIVELPAARAVSGWAELEPGGALALEGLLLYEPSRLNPELAAARALPPDVLFGADMAPAESWLLLRLQRSFREFWESLPRKASDDERRILEKVHQVYGEVIEVILPEMGTDFALYVQAHPSARAAPDPNQDRAPMPYLALAASCRDPALVSLNLRRIFQAEADKIAKQLSDRPPTLDTETLGEAEIVSLNGLTSGVKDSICPDFSPGFATWRDRVLLFTARPFAHALFGALAGDRKGLASTKAFGEARDRGFPRSNFTLAVDPRNFGEMIAMPGYSLGYARMMKPVDWGEIDRDIRARRGDALGLEELAREQAAGEARAKQEQARFASQIARASAVYGLFKSFRLDGLNEGGPGKTPGLRARVVLVFDTE